MAENFNEQELQALFRRHLPYRQMPPEFAERLKQQVLTEVANTLQSSTLTAAVTEEARFDAPETGRERPLQPYVRQPNQQRSEAKGGMWDWLQQRLRLAPSLTLAGATLAAILAFVVWGPMLLREFGLQPQPPGTGAQPPVVLSEQTADTEVASMLTPTATETITAVVAGGVVTATVPPTAVDNPTSAAAVDAPASTAITATVAEEISDARGTPDVTVPTAATANNQAEATATPTLVDEANTPTSPSATPTKNTVVATATTTTTDDERAATPVSQSAATATASRTNIPTRTPVADSSTTPASSGSPVPTKSSTSGEANPTNTPTPVSTPRRILEPTATDVAPTKSPSSAQPTLAPFTLTPKPKPTITNTPVPPTRVQPTMRPFLTATDTPTKTPVPPTETSSSVLPTPTVTDTPVPPTDTPTKTPVPPTPTNTPTPTDTDTAVPPTDTPTKTPVPPTPTDTNTPVPPTPTNTPTPTDTNTPVPPTPTPTDTNTPVPPTATATPTPPNRPPVVREIRVSGDEDNQISIRLLEYITDEDNNSLHIDMTRSGENGSAVLQGQDGVVLYTPSANFFGTDTFTFEVNDTKVTVTGIVEVTVRAVNDQPTFERKAPENSLRVNENFEWTVTATDNDPSDTLEIRAPEGAPLPDWLKLERVGNGQAKLSGSPTVGDMTHTIRLEVVDGVGGRDEWEFTLTVMAPADGPIGANETVSGAGVSDLPTVSITAPLTTTVP